MSTFSLHMSMCAHPHPPNPSHEDDIYNVSYQARSSTLLLGTGRTRDEVEPRSEASSQVLGCFVLTSLGITDTSKQRPKAEG